MKYKFVTRVRTAMSAKSHTFRRRQDGIAAVEFGLLAPVLMLMLLGMLEIGLALSVDRKLSMAVASVADLVARENSATTASVKSITDVAGHLMYPYDASKIKLTVKSIRTDLINTTKGQIQWSYAHNGGVTSAANCSEEALAKELLGAGAVGISVEGSYDYTTLVTKYVIKSNINFTDNAMMSPRKGTVIYNGNTTPCP